MYVSRMDWFITTSSSGSPNDAVIEVVGESEPEFTELNQSRHWMFFLVQKGVSIKLLLQLQNFNST